MAGIVNKEYVMDRGHLVNNSRLLRNLNTCIDEDRLMHTISQLSSQVDKIESVSGPSRRTIKLRNEIARLEDQLSIVRIKLIFAHSNIAKPNLKIRFIQSTVIP